MREATSVVLYTVISQWILVVIWILNNSNIKFGYEHNGIDHLLRIILFIRIKLRIIWILTRAAAEKPLCCDELDKSSELKLFISCCINPRIGKKKCQFITNCPWRTLNTNYYSFKIFPWFWLAKSTCIIHHNQLSLTKFGRSLPLVNRWCQKCSFLTG